MLCYLETIGQEGITSSSLSVEKTAQETILKQNHAVWYLIAVVFGQWGSINFGDFWIFTPLTLWWYYFYNV